MKFDKIVKTFSEQRITGIITFFFIGLSVTMTRLLSNIPMPVLYGVFLYMGISALGGFF